MLAERGYWGLPGKPAHTNVSAVLLAEGIHYGRVAQYAPAFWAHPNATQPVEPLPIWRVTHPTAEGTQYVEPSLQTHKYFDLPEGWPVGEPFPR